MSVVRCLRCDAAKVGDAEMGRWRFSGLLLRRPCRGGAAADGPRLEIRETSSNWLIFEEIDCSVICEEEREEREREEDV